MIMNGSELLKAENITYKFADGTIGIDGVNAAFYPDEMTILAGRNGSGKTILSRLLSGIITPESGTVSCRGLPLDKYIKTGGVRPGIVFQDPEYQILSESVWDDVLLGPANLGMDKKSAEERAAFELERFGLLHKRDMHPYYLSGGEKRRLAMAGVLAMNPEIIIFDEPFANLDYPSIKNTISEILRIRSDGRSVIILTHEIEKILGEADRLMIIDSGRIVEDTTPERVAEIDLAGYGLRNPFTTYSKISDLTWGRD